MRKPLIFHSFGGSEGPSWPQVRPTIVQNLQKIKRIVNPYTIHLFRRPSWAQVGSRFGQLVPTWPQVGPNLAQHGLNLAPTWPLQPPKSDIRMPLKLKIVKIPKLSFSYRKTIILEGPGSQIRPKLRPSWTKIEHKLRPCWQKLGQNWTTWAKIGQNEPT